jgi:hypothetical protein
VLSERGLSNRGLSATNNGYMAVMTNTPVPCMPPQRLSDSVVGVIPNPALTGLDSRV